jgi:hypothetical protein
MNLEKCVFAAPSLEILGHMLLATGAAPTAYHATEIENCPPPQDIKQLQWFLGGDIVPIAPIGVVLLICSTNKYRVLGPIDFYVGSTTPIGAIGTIAPHLLVV